MVEREDWALVLGGADCVWWDLIQLEKIIGKAWPGYVIAVNDVGVHWVRDIHAWCSLHTDKLMHNARELGRLNGSWMQQREANGHPMDTIITYSKKRRKHGTDRSVEMHHAGGSSGMLAVCVARDMGCRKIVLCGTPMSVRKHFSESLTHTNDRKWSAADSHFRAWRQSEDDLKKDTRSMSGRTRQLLGYPTKEWLT